MNATEMQQTLRAVRHLEAACGLEAVAAATRWIEARGAAVATRPLVTSDGDGHPVFEWWLPDRKYTVYIEPSMTTVALVDTTSEEFCCSLYEGLPA